MPTLILGHVAGLALFAASKLGWWTLHFTVNAFLLALLCACALWAFSRGRQRADVEPDTLWTPAMSAVSAGTGVLRDYRIWAALVVLGVVASVLLFA